MDIDVAKVLSAVFLFILTMLFSVIPYFIIKKWFSTEKAAQTRQWILGHINCFSGGVFLATLLCHILPEGDTTYNEWKEEAGKDWEYPLFNIFVAIGFFLVIVVEMLARKLMGKNQNQVEDIKVKETDEKVTNEETLPSRENPEDQITHDNTPKPEGVRAFLLLTALSFHTIFDGLAIGLQEEESEVWVIFAAIAIHKSVVAFCVGLELFQASKNKLIKALIWLFVFAIMSPIGVGIGIGVTSGSHNELARLLISSILQGMSAGTFMYVTFLEILSLYIGHHGSGNLFHVLWALVGFVGMALTRLMDHGHDHDDH